MSEEARDAELRALREYVAADDAMDVALRSDRYADQVSTQRLVQKRSDARARMMEVCVLTTLPERLSDER